MAIINYNGNDEYHWWLLELFGTDLEWYFSRWYSNTALPSLDTYRNSIVWC
jgi:hypothetical protein